MFKKTCAVLVVTVFILSIVSVSVVAATFVPSQAVAHGIDVSEHQGYINWDSVKASGKVDFVIIRCGFGQDQTSQDDDYFLTNAQECQRVGIPFGLYLYSYTTTTSGALGEADHAIRLINQCKSYSMFQLPIYYDLEESSAYALSNSAVLEFAKAFHDKVESSTGKTVGIYANTNWFTNKLTDSWYQQQPSWCAQYSSSCTYAGDYDLWQYSDSGSVSGISGGVDVNYSRVPVSQIAGVSTTPTLSTNKTVYQRTSSDVEPVMVSATCSASDSWVGIFPASADVTTAGSIAWFYCNDGGANPRDIWYSNYDTSVAWPVAAGDYKVVLFGDGGKTNVLKTINISVVSATITTDASTYCVNNDIYVSTDYYASDAWVGLYESGATPSGSTSSLYWYYLSSGGTSNTNIFGFNRVRPEDYKAGKYDIILFADDGYNVLAKKTVTVKNCTDSTTDSDHKCDYCGTDGITSHTYDQKNTASKYQKSAATCTKKAVYYYSCRCGAKGTSTFSSGSALGHSYKSSVTTEATCNTDGVRTYTCSTCKDKYTEAIPATGNHSYTGVITKQPTCTENGIKTFTCSACGDEYTEIITDSNAHKYPETYEGNEDNWIVSEGNCLSETVAHPNCTLCGKTDMSVSYSLGYGKHSMGAIEWDTEAGCTKDGHGTAICEVCWVYEEEHTIPAKGSHTKSDAVYEKNTATGCYDAVVKCSECGEDITRIKTDIPNTIAVNTAISQETYVNVSTSVGICTVLVKSELSDYASYSIRYSRVGTDADYNLANKFDEVNEMLKFTSQKDYTIYSGIGLFEMNLPVSVTVCGYDANGNLIAVSTPYVTTITEEMWLLYNKDGTTDAQKKAYVDLINMGTLAQQYFAEQKTGCDLESVVYPKDVYAFDQSFATKDVPNLDTATLPENMSQTIGGKTCELSVSVNMSSGAPAISYIIKRGASVTDVNDWKLTSNYTTGAPSAVAPTTATGKDFGVSGTYAYYNYAPALYDTNKKVTTVISYNGTEHYEIEYSVEAYIALYLESGATDTMAQALGAIAKFGASCRAVFGYA